MQDRVNSCVRNKNMYRVFTNPCNIDSYLFTSQGYHPPINFINAILSRDERAVEIMGHPVRMSSQTGRM